MLTCLPPFNIAASMLLLVLLLNDRVTADSAGIGVRYGAVFPVGNKYSRKECVTGEFNYQGILRRN